MEHDGELDGTLPMVEGLKISSDDEVDYGVFYTLNPRAESPLPSLWDINIDVGFDGHFNDIGSLFGGNHLIDYPSADCFLHAGAYGEKAVDVDVVPVDTIGDSTVNDRNAAEVHVVQATVIDGNNVDLLPVGGPSADDNVVGSYLIDPLPCDSGMHDVPLVEVARKQIQNSSKRKRTCRALGFNCFAVFRPDIVSQNLERPQHQVAAMMNMGLSRFKRECRAMGIKRWPGRKLRSITNVLKTTKVIGLKDDDAQVRTMRNRKCQIETIPNLEMGTESRIVRRNIYKTKFILKRKAAAAAHQGEEGDAAARDGQCG